MNDPIADPMEKDSLQQRQQMWNVARRKPIIRRITPPPKRPCVALCQSVHQNNQQPALNTAIIAITSTPDFDLCSTSHFFHRL